VHLTEQKGQLGHGDQVNRNMPKIVQGLEGKFIVGGEGPPPRQREDVFEVSGAAFMASNIHLQPPLAASIRSPSPRTGSLTPLGATRLVSWGSAASRRARSRAPKVGRERARGLSPTRHYPGLVVHMCGPQVLDTVESVHSLAEHEAYDSQRRHHHVAVCMIDYANPPL